MKVKEFLKQLLYDNDLTHIWILNEAGAFLYTLSERYIAIHDFGESEVNYWYIDVDYESEVDELNIRIK